MAHPYKSKCSTDREAGRSRYRAEGGRINPSTGAPSRPLSSTKSEMDAPGPSPGAYKPITPEIRNRMQRRLENAGDDDAVRRVVKDASKYGVDWSHHLKGGD